MNLNILMDCFLFFNNFKEICRKLKLGEKYLKNDNWLMNISIKYGMKEYMVKLFKKVINVKFCFKNGI